MSDAASADFDERLALLLAELTDRVQRGEQVDLEEECRRQPDLADELRMLWGAVLVADAVPPRLSVATARRVCTPSPALIQSKARVGASSWVSRVPPS